METRHEYVLDLEAWTAPLPTAAVDLRVVAPGDGDLLADLMLDAYRGTIDYDGETLDDCRAEIAAYVAGERGGPALLRESRLAARGPEVAGACLASLWTERQVPLVAYVMTRAAWKGQAVGRQTLEAVLVALREQGYAEVRAVITKGNVPSERLFLGVGFRRVG